MNSAPRLTSGTKWILAGLALAGALLWGGRRAYCHLYGDMAKSHAQSSAAEARARRVTVIEPLRRAAVRSITLPATVEAFEKATLYAKVAGYLQWIKVDRGDRVRKGEVLALLAIPEMEKEYRSAQAAVLEADAAAERAQADAALKELTYKRLASVRESQADVISEQEVDEARARAEVAHGEVKFARAKIERLRAEAERIEALMDYARIKSPYDGIITERFVDPGNLIQNAAASRDSAPIVTVMDMDRVRVFVDVPEPDVAEVDRGDPVEVEFDGLVGKIFRAAVTRFATALSPGTRTMRVEIDLPNPNHLIRPGMYGRATLRLAEQAEALFLPAESLRVDAEGNKFVLVVQDGRVRKVAVETGLDDGKLIQVKGLTGGEQVVLASPGALEEGAAVEAQAGGA
ncbi:MAG: efflux RND transporter periplasmic adaptor subunit [Acidobacteria bacterium]|nr:efflux RND transporter periplasmic adaptor subunit [Acidobacteriota bacterium]